VLEPTTLASSNSAAVRASTSLSVFRLAVSAEILRFRSSSSSIPRCFSIFSYTSFSTSKPRDTFSSWSSTWTSSRPSCSLAVSSSWRVCCNVSSSMVEWLIALMSLVLSMETSWLRSGCSESVESLRMDGCGVEERGSGMVFMPSLSDWDCAARASCGTEMERVTSFGMGDRERRREGVMLPDPWLIQGAVLWVMKLYAAHVSCGRRWERRQRAVTRPGDAPARRDSHVRVFGHVHGARSMWPTAAVLARALHSRHCPAMACGRGSCEVGGHQGGTLSSRGRDILSGGGLWERTHWGLVWSQEAAGWCSRRTGVGSRDREQVTR
jgi:hypothetical protein